MAKFVRYRYKSIICYGILNGDSVQRISGSPFDLWEKQGDIFSLSEVRIISPCTPSKVVAVGLNYKDHARELGMKIPEEPVLFIKPNTSICGPDDPVVYPLTSKQVDYEAELGIVIGRKAKDIDVSSASDFILGYTCVNDVTARDLQKLDGQWTRAKSFDTFCPVGPCIETELDPMNCKVKCLLNGELKQDSSTCNQIFSPYFLVSFISGIMTLLPGDIIATGTPPGVGPMKAGDEVEVVIEGVGRLKNIVQACP